ncbi:MAG: DNA recombination protein RmuC [Pseudomonadota bacterium]
MSYLVVASLLVSGALGVMVLGVLRLARSGLRALEERRQAGEDNARRQVEALGARLDNAAHGINGNLATVVQHMGQSLVRELSAVREDVRAKVDERLAGFQAEQQRLAGALRDSLQQDLAQGRKELSEATLRLAERFERLQAGNEARLGEIRGEVERRLSESVEKNFSAFKGVAEQLGNLRVTNERILEFSRDLDRLSSILESPKLRGDFGEFGLENMLRQVVPEEHFQLQAQIGAERVDALIRLKEGCLCVDSKFPLENLRRLMDSSLPEEERKRARRQFGSDVRRHIEAICHKYIVPRLTLDFALMYVPAEAVYYEILMDHELHAYALERRVIPVSPNSFYAILQSLAIGFRCLRIADESRHIEQILLALKKQFDAFKDHFRLVGTHLERARSQFASADSDVQRFDATFGGLRLGRLEQPAPQDSLAEAAGEEENSETQEKESEVS